MFHHRIRTIFFAVTFLVLGFLWMVAIPAFAQVIGGSTPIGTPVGTLVDFAPLAQAVIAALWLLVMIAGAWFIMRYVNNQEARSALLNVLAAAASFGVNATKGAIKDKPMTVDVASNVLATSLRYAMAQAPDALKHFGFDEKTTARALLARLPGVEGEITDDTLNKIVSGATGVGPAGGLDIKSLTDGIMAEIASRKTGGAPAPAIVVPAPASPPAPASTAPATPSSAAPPKPVA